MTGIDVAQIEHEILQLLTMAVGAGILWLLKMAIAYLGHTLTADRQHALNIAVDKMMTFGVAKADTWIRDRGWDHIDSQNAVINFALPALKTKFEDTLSANGIDLRKDADRVRIVEMMQRMWPDIATRLAKSPTTAPAEDPPLPHIADLHLDIPAAAAARRPAVHKPKKPAVHR